MNVILNICKVTLEEGFMYAILALGLYITYSILDFPDLSVDGTMPLGAIITALLILREMCIRDRYGCALWRDSFRIGRKRKRQDDADEYDFRHLFSR